MAAPRIEVNGLYVDRFESEFDLRMHRSSVKESVVSDMVGRNVPDSSAIFEENTVALVDMWRERHDK